MILLLAAETPNIIALNFITVQKFLSTRYCDRFVGFELERPCKTLYRYPG